RLYPLALPDALPILALTGIALIGVTIVAAGLAIVKRHDEAVARYRHELARLSVVLAEQTARSLQSIDLVLQEIQAWSLAAGAGRSEEHTSELQSLRH